MQRPDSPIITKTFNNLRKFDKSRSWITESTSSNSDTEDVFPLTSKRRRKTTSKLKKTRKRKKLLAAKQKISSESSEFDELPVSPILRRRSRQIVESSPEIVRDAPRAEIHASPKLTSDPQKSGETRTEANLSSPDLPGYFLQVEKCVPKLKQVRGISKLCDLTSHQVEVEVPASSQVEVPASSQVEVPASSDADDPTSHEVKEPTSRPVEDPTSHEVKKPTSRPVEDPSSHEVKGLTSNHIEDTNYNQQADLKSRKFSEACNAVNSTFITAGESHRSDLAWDISNIPSRLTSSSSSDSLPVWPRYFPKTLEPKQALFCKSPAPVHDYTGQPTYTSSHNFKQGNPSSSKQAYPSSSKQAYPSSSKQGNPSTSKQGYPSSSKQGYPSSSKQGNPSSSKAGFPGTTIKSRNSKLQPEKRQLLYPHRPRQLLRPAREAAVTAFQKLTAADPLEEALDNSGGRRSPAQDSGSLFVPDSYVHQPDDSSESDLEDLSDDKMRSKERSRLSRKKADGEETDVIVIMDDDSSGSERRASAENSADPLLLTYKDVSVNLSDYTTLEEGEFLNDNIIQFYLTYLKEEVLEEKERENVYVFSTHFFSSLCKARKNEPGDMSEEQKRYKRVERWTKNIDLINKDMIIFPICEEAHWYLILAVKPSLISVTEADRPVKGQPFLILLDSMGGGKERAVSKIRQYLAAEWNAKTGGTEKFSGREMRLLKPGKPEQQNFYDCGVYLLHYVEKIFESVTKFYWKNLPSLSEWFPQEEIDKKRYNLAQFIQKLARDQGREVQFPKIKLNKEAKRSKRRKSRLNYEEDFAFNPFLDDPGEGEGEGEDKEKRSLRTRKPAPRHNTRPKRKMQTPAAEAKNNQDQPVADPEAVLRLQQRLQGNYKIPRKQDNLKPHQIRQTLEALEQDCDKSPDSASPPGDQLQDQPDGGGGQAQVEKKRAEGEDEKQGQADKVSTSDKENSEDKTDEDHKNGRLQASDSDDKSGSHTSARAAIDPSTRETLAPGEVPYVSEPRKQFKQFLDKEKPSLKAQVHREGFNKFLSEKSRQSSESKILAEYDPHKYKDDSHKVKEPDMPSLVVSSSPETHKNLSATSQSPKKSRSSPRVSSTSGSSRPPLEKKEKRLSEKVKRIRADWSMSDSSEADGRSPKKNNTFPTPSNCSLGPASSPSPPLYPPPQPRADRQQVSSSSTADKQQVSSSASADRQQVSSSSSKHHKAKSKLSNKKRIVSTLTGENQKKLKYQRPMSIEAKVSL